MKILVTGGAGYIGSHTVKELKKNDHEVVVFDNFSSGHRSAIKDTETYEGDLSNIKDIEDVFTQHVFDAVIHFAGSIEAGESMTDPQRFFRNNLVNSLNLLDVMLEKGVKKIVFSSSAAVYGEPEKIPVEEGDPKIPTNYYGLTKLMFEEILEAYDTAYGIKSVSLRYFNAAGADSSGEIGADHKNKTHLITLVMLAALGQRESIKIFGTDFETEDGTGVRDYIHVSDLASAHLLALDYLNDGNDSNYFNLGNERGNSVKEVVDLTKEITKKDFKVEFEGRREGDPAKLVASSKRAKEVLSWKPAQSDIKVILETAWNWHQKNPQGYND